MSFGSRGYWHMIPGAPEGSSDHCATELLNLWRSGNIKKLIVNSAFNDASGSAAKDIARAIALELAVASATNPGGIPPSVAELVREILPQWAYAIIDPVEVYSGRQAGRGQRPSVGRERFRSLCQQLDVEFAEKCGRIESAESLADRLITLLSNDQSLAVGVSEGWGDAPNLARSIRRWREEYAGELQFAVDNCTKTAK